MNGQIPTETAAHTVSFSRNGRLNLEWDVKQANQCDWLGVHILGHIVYCMLDLCEAYIHVLITTDYANITQNSATGP